jgi:hypothetical protein
VTMDFWKSQPHYHEENAEEERERAPSFFDNLVDFAKDEALGAAVEHLSGGWITMEDDGADDRHLASRRNESFEERLQRELKKLGQEAPVAPYEAKEASDMPTTEAAPIAPPEQTMPQPPAYSPAPRQPAFRGPQGFGRKGLS